MGPNGDTAAMENHLNSSSHEHRSRLRWITESETVKEAVRTTTGRGGVVLQKALADLASIQLSVFQLEDRYFALTGQTILILAVKRYAIYVLEHLLDEGLKAQRRDSGRRTALHWACYLGRFDMAGILIRKGARLDDQDAQNHTPIDVAVQAGFVDAAVNLVEAEAEIIQDSTPLARACRHSQLQIIERMVRSGVNANHGDITLSLDVALYWAPWKAVQLLLEAGQDGTDTVSAVDITLLCNKKDGVYTGPPSAYRDAAEKLALLEQHGLNPKRVKWFERLQPSSADTQIFLAEAYSNMS